MTEYHKIDAPFLRDKKGVMLHGEWCRPEFEYLASLDWEFTEKVDGTNIRLMFKRDGDYMQINYGGRTDNAQIPPALLAALKEIVDVSAPEIHKVMTERDIDELVVYGEGYGPKINGGGKYRDTPSFVAFDVKVGNFWLMRDAVDEFCNRVGLDSVPVIFIGTLWAGFHLVTYGSTRDFYGNVVNRIINTPTGDGFKSSWGDFEAEGVVAVPRIPLFNRQGNRIITKIKAKDFRRGS